MKVGIVTYHRTQNFGAALQAVATRVILERMGHEVFYVDYWPSYHKAKYSVFPYQELKGKSFSDKVLFILYELSHRLIPRIKRKRCFDMFLSEYVIPYCVPTNMPMDVVVYGSDQIWRKQATGKYNPFYFGVNEIPSPLHVSYAASAGELPSSREDKQVFRELVSHLDRVSVREEDLAAMLSEIGIQNVKHVLDPTLLLKRDQWDSLLVGIKPEGKYVLVYSPASASCFDLAEVRLFAEKKGIGVIELKGEAYRERDGMIANCGPSQFVSLIKNAEYVFSSSFHGVAFSVIFQRQFYASFKRNSTRVSSLLHALGIENRMIAPYSPIPDVADIDYSSVDKRLDCLREESIDCMRNMLH